MTAGLPSAAGTFLSRVCVPFSVPFSTTKVGTTLCQTLAGSAPSKSSENRSSFFSAIGFWRDGGGIVRKGRGCEDDENGHPPELRLHWRFLKT